MARMLGMRDPTQLTAQDLQGLDAESAQALVEHIQRQAREIALKEAKLEKVAFELARLKAWKFAAKSEAMSEHQRRLFEETVAEDEADLQARLRALGAKQPDEGSNAERPRRARRQALPAHLRRVEHRHEPDDTTCPTPGCRAGSRA